VLDDLIALAKTAESPRAYEVVSTMLKTFADLELNIMDLHKKRIEVLKGTPSQEAGTINNNQNNYYVSGSSRDLTALLTDDENHDET
jgi:hypothetical protein